METKDKCLQRFQMSFWSQTTFPIEKSELSTPEKIAIVADSGTYDNSFMIASYSSHDFRQYQLLAVADSILSLSKIPPYE